MGMIQDTIKPMVRGCYSIQKLRIETGNRIVANFKAKLGQKPSSKEETIDIKAKELLETLRIEHKCIADGVGKVSVKDFKGQECISSYAEYALIGQYQRLADAEKINFAELSEVLKTVPIYNEFLANVKGIGPAMAGVIISEIDIHRSKYTSSIWKYCGLDVVIVEEINGDEIVYKEEGRSRKKAHQIEIEYENAKGEKTKRMGITFNPWLKSKLLGALAPTFLKIGAKEKKAGRPHKYAELYYNYKHRIDNHKRHKDKTKAHRHNMAMRYMIKQFLADLYEEWRAIEGLEVYKPYAEDKLGLVHEAK